MKNNFKHKKYNLALICVLCIFITTHTLTSCKHSDDINDNHESLPNESSTTLSVEVYTQIETTISTDITTLIETTAPAETTIPNEATVPNETTSPTEHITPAGTTTFTEASTTTTDATTETTTIPSNDNHANISKGIDVSKWQSVNKKAIDWNKVKDSGISFVIIRAGYRSATSNELCQDPYFQKHIEGALKAGLQVGVYFHSQAITENEVLEEVDYLISLIKNYDITYPVCCDYEPSLSSREEVANIDKNLATHIASTFLSKIKSHGYDAMLYSDHNDINNFFNVNKLSEYKIWIGCYDKKYEKTGVQYEIGDALPQESYTYHMWQYSCTGRVPGIQGDVDLNVAFFQP